MPELTPSERRHQRTRQSIIDAAGELLRHQGLDGLSIRSLAEAVDYSPSALYQYFPNKDAILAALGEQGFAHMDSLMTSYLTNIKNNQEGIRGFAKALRAFAENYPHFFLVMFADESIPRRSMADVKNNPQFNVLVTFFEQGAASEAFHLPEDYSAFEAAFHLWMTLHGISLIHLKFIAEPEKDFRPLTDQIVEQEIRFLTGK